jgi:flavodoxin
MKSAVIYYSYSGNTRKVAQALAEYLRQRAEVQILELKAKDEPVSFFGQCKRAFWHKQADIESIDPDFSSYDLICLGSPVWAFGPAPAVNTFLEQCKGAAAKKVVLFTTYGSGTGNQRSINHMQRILAKKGAQDFKRFSIQQYKVDDKEYVLSRIREVIG